MSCNPFAPEFHYLGLLAQALNALRIPNQALLLGNADVVRSTHFALFQTTLDEAWKTLGKPEYLVVKHCFLTPLFDVIAKQIPRALFITTIRDPRCVVASLLRSILRAHPDTTADKWLPTLVPEWINRYNTSYGAVVRGCLRADHRRFLNIDHRHLGTEIVGSLERFLNISDINPDALWSRAVFDIQTMNRDPLFSPGWGRALGCHRNDTFGDVLEPAVADRLLEKTAIVRTALNRMIETPGSRTEEIR
jgi:hypothetical protein